jgi:DNA-binding winged helix-turn-helix (wHTH) protein/Tol biopolymer transport system component
MTMRYRLGDFVVEPALNQISSADGVSVLEPKAIDLLVFFMQNPGQITSRDQIRTAVWGPISVSDHAVNRLISQLRKALGDNTQPYQYIETVTKRGYRLICPVDVQKPQSRPAKWAMALVATLVGIVLIGAVLAAFLLVQKPDSLKNFVPKGKVQAVTSMPGREWQVKLSADARWLSFLHQNPENGERRLFVKNQTTGDEKPLLSGRGRISAYSWLGKEYKLAVAIYQSNRCTIEVFDFESERVTLNQGQQIVDCGNKPVSKLAYSQSNQSLYWLSRETTQIGENSRLHLFSMADKRAIPGQTALPQIDNLYDVVASSDGTQLVLLSHYQWERGSIYLYDVVNQHLVKLRDSNEVIRSISWARDDNALFMIENDRFKLMDLSGTVVALGFSSDNRITGGYFSPNEEVFYYGRSTAKSQMYVLGQALEPAPWGAQHNERNPTFAHDGKQLAFISQRSGQYRIWLRLADGQVNQLKTGDLDLSQTLLRWSADDRYLMFHSFNSVYRYDLDTHRYRKISPDDIYADVVGWSYRDNNKVYVRSDVDGQFNIWLLDLTTKQMEKITEEGGFSANESRDGRFLYYTKELKNGLWRLDSGSGEHQMLSGNFPRENHLSWYLLGDNVYHLYANQKPPGLHVWLLNDNSQQQLWQMPVAHFGSFALSSHDKSTVWGLLSQGQWDIMRLNGIH